MKNTMGIMYSNGDFEAWDIECSKSYDIDRAMVWCEEYLREQEVTIDIAREYYALNGVDIADDSIDTCVRYLEKVEAL